MGGSGGGWWVVAVVALGACYFCFVLELFSGYFYFAFCFRFYSLFFQSINGWKNDNVDNVDDGDDDGEGDDDYVTLDVSPWLLLG